MCGTITGLRSDLVPYALAMVVDDFIYTVMEYPKSDWEDVLDNKFGDHSEVWDKLYAIRAEVFKLLVKKIGEEAIAVSLEELTHAEDPNDSSVTITTLSNTQRLKVRDFVSNGLGY